MLGNMWRGVGVVLVLVFSVAEGSADTVYLRGGDVISGTITSFDAKKLKITTSYAGKIAIEAGEVARVSTSEPIVMKLGDGREVSGRIVSSADGAMRLEKASGGQVPIELASISSFAPPKPPRPWFRYKGEVNAGFNASSGNTETQGYHVAGYVEPAFGNNVFSLKGQLNRSESKVDSTDSVGNPIRVDEPTASNWRVLGQYNRFLNDYWYAFLNNGWENDDLKDLNVRISTATGLGYKPWDDEMRYLTLELGPGLVYENFKRVIDAAGKGRNPDRDYITARWALDYDQGIFRPDTRFYHNHSINERVDDLETFILQSATGLKFSIIGDINAGAEVQFDWNNDPAEDAKEQDLRYLLKLGYVF